MFQCSNYLVVNNDDLARPYYKRWRHHGKTPHLFGLPGSLPRLKRGNLSIVGCPGSRRALGSKELNDNGEWSGHPHVNKRYMSSKAQEEQLTSNSVYKNPKVIWSTGLGGLSHLTWQKKKYIKLAISMQEFFGIMWLHSSHNGASVLHSKVGRLDRIFNDLTSF